MKIRAFDISRFGVWNTLSMPHLSEGLNVIYGPNEAGKTTLLEFIRAMLYGFGENRLRFVRPRSLEYGGGAVVLGESLRGDENSPRGGLPRGGEMILHGPNGIYHVRRTYHAERIGHEEITEVTGRDGVLRGEHLLRILATGIDEATFNNIFAVGLDEIQRLATLGDSDAADVLFRLSIGLDRVSLMEVLREMRQTRHRLIDPSGKGAGITRLLKKRREVVYENRHSELALREYAKLRSEHNELDRVIAQLETELAERRRESTLYETLLRVLPIFDRREELTTQIASEGEVTEIPDDAMKQLTTLENQLLEKSQALESTKAQFANLHKERAALTISASFLRMVPRLESLLEEERRVIALDEQIQILQTEIAPLEQKLQTPIKSPQKSPVKSGDYRQLARQLKKARVRLTQAKKTHHEISERYNLLDKTLTEELQRREVESLADALEQVSDEAAQWRRRQTIAQRLAEMTQYHREAAYTHQHLLAHQALPLGMLAGLGAAAITGIVLVGLAIFGKIEMAYGILGGIGVVAGVATKIILERRNAERLAQSQRQIRALLTQTEQATKEMNAIDSRYASVSNEAPEARLARVEHDLIALEQLLPTEAKRRDLLTQLAETETRLKKAKRILQAATQAWNEWLQQAGLPNDWNLPQVRDWLNEHHVAGEARREIEYRQMLLAQRRDEMRLLTDRIDVAVVDAGVKISAGAGYLDILATFRQRLESYRLTLAQRKKWRHETRLVNRARRKTLAELTAVRRKLEMLLVPFEVKTPSALRKKHQHFLGWKELKRQRDSVARELLAGLGNICAAEEAFTLLAPERREELAPRLAVLQRAAESLAHKLHEQLQQRGRLDEQITRLVSDPAPMQRLREVAILDERMRTAIYDWQRAAVAGLLLDEIRQTYERERQPQTLFDTSVYLKEFTAGKYIRVWAPLGEETLYVDDVDGNTWDVAWLSRGTREQLFIALRLALAHSFARHGSSLPLILDDVLVNCDTQRAEAMANILLNLAAEGQQIFLFTCHEHICRIFQDRDVSVLVLPSPRVPESQVRVLLPASLENESIEKSGAVKFASDDNKEGQN